MQMPKGKALLLTAGMIASALIYGCGSGSSNNIIPSVVTIFDAHNAVFRNHSVVTAGYNGFGQLGFDYGNLSDQTTYHPIAPNIVTFNNSTTGVAVGAVHTVAFGQASPFSNITGHSLAFAWGSNYHGQLGDGTATPTTGSSAYSRVPVRVGASTADRLGNVIYPNVPLTGVIGVAAGGFHSLALTSEANGTVYSWGYNGYGELGTNNFIDRIWPGFVLKQDFSPLTNIKAIAAGADHCLALGNDGTVYAWGDNTYGQVGVDNTNALFQKVTYATQVQIPDTSNTKVPLSNITQIAAGGISSIALQDDGVHLQVLYFWGNNIGHPDVSTVFLSTPMPIFLPGVVDATHRVLKIAVGLDHILLLVNTDPSTPNVGIVYSIGFNGYGQLGDATIVSRPVGIAHNNTFSNLSSAATGPTTWANFSSARGTGLVKSQWVADDISAFGSSSMAHIPGIGWYGWGDNGHGQLGAPVSTSSIGYLLTAVPSAGLQGLI